MAIILRCICSFCGAEFDVNPSEYSILGLSYLPKRCPKCIDIQQKRPDITLSRKELFSSIVQIHSLPPGEWSRYQAAGTDVPVWRMLVKGSLFGASWNGRIDLWATGGEPPKPSDVVQLSWMESVKRIVKKEPEVDRDQATSEVEEVRRYVRLDPAPDAEPNGRVLVWASAHSKTTLKGFGRQYSESLEESSIWKLGISGGVRSGRERTSAVLAIVHEDSPIRIIHREGGSLEERYIPSDPPPLEEI